jgi:hypothetical protein
VAERLAASQEGLRSMELLSYYLKDINYLILPSLNVWFVSSFYSFLVPNWPLGS